MAEKSRGSFAEDGTTMMRLFATIIVVSVQLLSQTSSLAWECEVDVTGPKTIKLDQQITLSASGTPAGGSYSWSRTQNLVPNGSTATITGFQPTFSEYIKVTGYYTSPKGKKCSDSIWLWACVCSLQTISGPATAQIGEEVTLSTSADPEGGTYSWTIETGSGTLTPNGASATFSGNLAGPTEIKVSYTPAEGGEPCTAYHTIQIEEACSVTLSVDSLQRPVCRPVNFHADGQPQPGDCTWSALSGFTTSGCDGTYEGDFAGYDTLKVTYTRPGGSSCTDSKSILSYTLINISPKKQCYLSGSTLSTDDFDIETTPNGHQHNAILSPAAVNITQKQAIQDVSAELVCDTNPVRVSTKISVVNESVTTGFGLEVTIPNLIKEPLNYLGLADKFEFKLENSYKQGTKCCTDAAKDYTEGQTAVTGSVDFSGKTIYGVPLPPKVQKYIRLDVLNIDLKGETAVSIDGEYKPCENSNSWSGGGTIAVKFGAGAEAKVQASDYLLLQGEAKGATDITESLAVNADSVDVKGKWGGVNVAGKFVVQVKKHQIKTFEIKYELLKEGSTPEMKIALPSLQ